MPNPSPPSPCASHPRSAADRRLTELCLVPVCFTVFCLTAVCPGGVAGSAEYFKIRIVDDQTGRGVPLVELRTVNNVRCWTDSAGVVAFAEPGLMDREVFFRVASHGYEFPKDGFGFRGRRATTTPGDEVTWRIRRRNIAERLYRVTGQGIYRDSKLLGEPAPIFHPLLNAGVLGSDSVVNAVFRGRVYWFWGDTNRAGYPLGNFHVPGATSVLPARGGLDVDRGINLEYFTNDDGFAKETARMPGSGPTWIGGLTVLPDADGRERMFAGYVKVRGQLDVYHRGLVEFDDASRAFRHVTDFDLDAPLHPDGHPFLHGAADARFVYFASPYPLVRVPATPEALADTSRYEAYTCLTAGSRRDEMRVDRDDSGRLRYAWRKNTPVVDQQLQQKLVAAGKAKAEDFLLQLRDVESGKPVLAHSGSVYWNEHRRRWVMVALEMFGTSVLGEVWYAEADTPQGPWAYARKIVTHEKYSFYNPKQHPMFAADGGRVLYFEGTYAHTFSGNDNPTPRYDYNQLMYRLDLADPRLALPAPIYAAEASQERLPRFLDGPALRDTAASSSALSPAFFALDRPTKDAVAIRAAADGFSGRLIAAAPDAEPRRTDKPMFYALPADWESPPAETAPLYEFSDGDGGYRYSTDAELHGAGYRRSAAPLCRVWRNPTSQRFKISD